MAVRLSVAAFGFFAWLTHYPDSQILRWAEERPWLEPLVKRFRRLYLSPEKSGDSVLPAGEVAGPDPYPDFPEEGLWVVGGTPIREAFMVG